MHANVLKFARIRRMTRLTANGRRVLCVRPVSYDDPPKSLHCSLDFFFECKDEDDASIRRYNFGRDGRISLDLKQYSAIKHVIGIVNFGYEEDGNHHTLNASEVASFQADVAKLQPSSVEKERKIAAAAARIANQVYDAGPVSRSKRRRNRVGRITGGNTIAEWTATFERWKAALAKMANLNWQVYSQQHLPAEVYDGIFREGKEDHVRAMIKHAVSLPGACSCSFCIEENITS